MAKKPMTPTPPTKEERPVDIFPASPMGAPVPNLSRVRSALKGLVSRGVDAKAAYELYRSLRSKQWAKMPDFDALNSFDEAQTSELAGWEVDKETPVKEQTQNSQPADESPNEKGSAWRKAFNPPE